MHPDLCTKGSPVRQIMSFLLLHTWSQKSSGFCLCLLFTLFSTTPQVLQAYLISYRVTHCCLLVLEPGGLLWHTSRVKSRTGHLQGTWLLRNQAVASFSLHGVSKCHSYLSWLTQAIPVSAPRHFCTVETLQAQSKCSVIHNVLSSENRQKYLFTLVTGWPSIHMDKLLTTSLVIEPESKQL